jgi:hypothetical protein
LLLSLLLLSLLLYYYYYYLTAIGLTPSAISTVQYSTVQYSTVQYTLPHKQYTEYRGWSTHNNCKKKIGNKEKIGKGNLTTVVLPQHSNFGF